MLETEFIKHYTSNSTQIMWFLGAGISRTAGMPTAMDLIWDLKFKYYCREENQNLDSHDINNDTVKHKIQSYMNSKGFPKLWSPEEYSFYFELAFGSDYASQQKYLIDKMNEDKISLNIGQRALAGLIGLKKTRIIFTTNFDGVIEKAYSQVCNLTLPVYHLEGSYAALEALNQERYPIYAKIHGDFRYQSVKNLSSDLISNDKEIQKCFLAASNRFGIVISGYSGRDKNVMNMFYDAIEKDNAFPFGLFWTVTNEKDVALSVREFIENAQKKGINAQIVEIGTFDSLLSKIWRQTENKSQSLEENVKTSHTEDVNITLPQVGNSYPILRTNALKIVSVASECAVIETKKSLSHTELKELLFVNKSNSIISREEQIIGWGNENEIYKALGIDLVKSISKLQILNPFDLILNNKGYHAFYERAIAISICDKKPLLFRNDKGFILAVDPNKKNDPLFLPLINALKDRYGKEYPISGIIPYTNIYWSEAVKIKIESRNNQLFLMIRPILWIEPKIERQKHVDFIKKKIQFRYNPVTHELLNAWIKILFGYVGNEEVELGCFTDSSFPFNFKINTRTAFSSK